MVNVAPVAITGAVEGVVDEAVLRRVVTHVGGTVGPVYGRDGKGYLRRNIAAYNSAAQFAPWLVLIDLDNDAVCAPRYRSQQLPRPTAFMCFRIAVREVESWIMADRESLAAYLHVREALIPADPEAVADAKAALLTAASKSRTRSTRVDMVPRPNSGAKVGPLYNTRMIEFVSTQWRPDVAAASADSLDRAMRRIAALVQAYRHHLRL